MNTSRTDTSIWPGLSYDDPKAARAWLAALGFQDGTLVPGERDGEVQHSEMLWPEGGRVMVSSRGTADQTFDSPRGSGNCYVVTAEPDAVFARASELGAEVVRPLRDEDSYESRGFSIRDPEGNRWSFGTYAGGDA